MSISGLSNDDSYSIKTLWVNKILEYGVKLKTFVYIDLSHVNYKSIYVTPLLIVSMNEFYFLYL